MTWFRVDDGFGEHRKVDSLGSETPHALCVWLLCGNASARALTDGHVSEAMLSRSCSSLSPTMRRRAVAALVKAGLWEERDDGWRFHDWLDHQPSRDLVVAEREKARERQRKHRASLAGVSHAVTDDVTSPSVTRPRPDPSRPVPTFAKTTETLSATALESALTRNSPKPAPKSPHAELASELCRTFKRLTGRAWTSEDDLLEALDGRGALTRSPMPEQVRAMAAHLSEQPEPIQAARRAMEGWAADPWVKANRFPMAHLVKDPLKYLTRAVSVSGVDSFEHASEEGPDFG